MAPFTDKVVLVTGASSGIGAGTAKLFAKQGAKLVITGRNEANLKETTKACEEEGAKSSDILVVLGDLTDEASCNNIVDKTIEKFGKLDVLINNAGSARQGTIETATVEDLDFMFNTLVRSVFMLTKRAIPHLKKTKGCIVNVSSIASIRPTTTVMVYGMAKAALNQFTKMLAQDVGPSGVRVNCILPGVIATNIHKGARWIDDNADPYANLGDIHALKRVGQVDEVANLIVFLSSSGASFITGTELSIDGGAAGMCAF